MIDKKLTRLYKKNLIDLTKIVIKCEKAIDREMKRPSTPERGKKIAQYVNALSMQNQIALHFGLGYSFKKIDKLYES